MAPTLYPGRQLVSNKIVFTVFHWFSGLYRAAVPSGASTGIYEALELRDKDPKRFLGKGDIPYSFQLLNSSTKTSMHGGVGAAWEAVVAKNYSRVQHNHDITVSGFHPASITLLIWN